LGLFHSRRPQPPLDTAVRMIWIVEGPAGSNRLERVLPTGAAQLIVNLAEDATRRYDPDRQLQCEKRSGTILAGPQRRFSIIDTREQEWVAGVAFRPGGTVRFMSTPASVTQDLDVDLEDLWPEEVARTLRERLLAAPDAIARLATLEQALLEAWRDSNPHAAVAYAVRAIAGRPAVVSMAEVISAIGMSPKRFIDRFTREVGLTPKRFCRILRFQRAIAAAGARKRVDWAAVASDGGYYDQSHLIHDFRDFAGMTPRAYLAARTRSPNHVTFFQDDDAKL
jgi:AraC-like DNA-binding protein